MSRLKDLLRELRTKEPALARDLEREVAALADRRAFGLNFERHVPEAVELPGRKVRKADKVRILPIRRQMPRKADEKLWRVIEIDRSAGTAEYHAEHNHGHYNDYANYILEYADTSNPQNPRQGTKTTFCIMDTTGANTQLAGASAAAVFDWGC